MQLPDRFLTALDALRLPPGRVLVAVSGGVDSVALLDLLAATRDRHGLEPIVAHVDHGIHPESAEVAERVRGLASRLGLPFEGTALSLGPAASETRARRARYIWLRETARRQSAQWILTAHHADDQRETVLLRMLRGSGPAGLAGMKARSRGVARPLLGFSRRTLLTYARSRGLEWWDDPANADPRHFRSWVRHSLRPRIEERVPDASRALDRLRQRAATHRRAWGQAVRRWPGLDLRSTGGETSLSWDTLRGLPLSLRLTLLEAVVRHAGGPAGTARLRRAICALRTGRSGARADLGQGWRCELAFGRLLLVPPATDLEPVTLPLAGSRGAVRWGGWRVRWVEERAPDGQRRDAQRAWFIPSSLAIRAPLPGDRLFPLGGRGRRLAVRCFQDAKIPRSERASWPVIEGADGVVWIPGVCRSATLLPGAGEPAVRIDVERCD